MQENQPPKKKSKEEIQQQIKAILAIDVPADGPIYHNCDEIRFILMMIIFDYFWNQSDIVVDCDWCAIQFLGQISCHERKRLGCYNPSSVFFLTTNYLIFHSAICQSQPNR